MFAILYSLYTALTTNEGKSVLEKSFDALNSTNSEFGTQCKAV